ncbi:hypothetical protein DFH06DRAFT_1132159 [Mycena polygramma]|nr:hypothetical protein DFH06DRAFT_1132159 [Mycena polygramma]
MVSRKTQMSDTSPPRGPPPEEAMDVEVEPPQAHKAESSSSAAAANTTSTTSNNTLVVAAATPVPPLRPLTRSLTGRASKPRARDDSWYQPPKKSPAPRKKAQAKPSPKPSQGRKRTYEEMDRAESEEPSPSATSTPKPPAAQSTPGAAQGQGGGVPPLNSTQAIFVDASASASAAPASGSTAGAGAIPHPHPNPYHNPTRARTNLPIPVPNLIKKSRGRRVPVVASLASPSSAAANSSAALNSSTTTSATNSSTNGTAGGTPGANGGANGGVNGAGTNAGDEERNKRLHVCKVEGCGKCFHRGEHLKRHIRSIHTHEKPGVGSRSAGLDGDGLRESGTSEADVWDGRESGASRRCSLCRPITLPAVVVADAKGGILSFCLYLFLFTSIHGRYARLLVAAVLSLRVSVSLALRFPSLALALSPFLLFWWSYRRRPGGSIPSHSVSTPLSGVARVGVAARPRGFAGTGPDESLLAAHSPPLRWDVIASRVSPAWRARRAAEVKSARRLGRLPWDGAGALRASGRDVVVVLASCGVPDELREYSGSGYMSPWYTNAAKSNGDVVVAILASFCFRGRRCCRPRVLGGACFTIRGARARCSVAAPTPRTWRSRATMSSCLTERSEGRERCGRDFIAGCTSLPPFPCTFPSCHKFFNRHDNLLQHVKVHRPDNGNGSNSGYDDDADADADADEDAVGSIAPDSPPASPRGKFKSHSFDSHGLTGMNGSGMNGNAMGMGLSTAITYPTLGAPSVGMGMAYTPFPFRPTMMQRARTGMAVSSLRTELPDSPVKDGEGGGEGEGEGEGEGDGEQDGDGEGENEQDGEGERGDERAGERGEDEDDGMGEDGEGERDGVGERYDVDEHGHEHEHGEDVHLPDAPPLSVPVSAAVASSSSSSFPPTPAPVPPNAAPNATPNMNTAQAHPEHQFLFVFSAHPQPPADQHPQQPQQPGEHYRPEVVGVSAGGGGGAVGGGGGGGSYYRLRTPPGQVQQQQAQAAV